MLTEETSLERMKLVTKLEKLIAKRKINHDITYYNALLHVYLDNDHRFSAISFFKNLEFKGCLPNRWVIEFRHRCMLHCDFGSALSQIARGYDDVQCFLIQSSLIFSAIHSGTSSNTTVDVER